MADDGVMTPFNGRNKAKTQSVTARPNPSPAAPGGPIRQGEKIPAGSLYPAYLNEYANLSPSCTENAGPEGPSANATMLDQVGKDVRKTGRI